MKIYGGVLAIAAVTLVLSGCSAPEAKAPVEAAELPTASASASAAPKVMSLKSSAEESASADEDFYFKAFDLWKSEGRSLPSDADLLKLGYEVCQQMDSGVGPLDVLVVEGSSEEAQGLNGYVKSAAVSALCTEHL